MRVARRAGSQQATSVTAASVSAMAPKVTGSVVLTPKSSPLMPEEPIYAAASREVAVERKVWESHRFLDRGEDAADSAFVDQYLRQRANRSLEHVFTLLSLTLPKRPLIIAFRALHTSDETLRGTALEYLEAVLPEAVRVGLWSFLEDRRGARPAPRARAEILAELIRANASVEDHLRDAQRDSSPGSAV